VSVFVTMMSERNLAFMTVSIAIQSELGSKDAALQEFDVGDVVSPDDIFSYLGRGHSKATHP
jgi:hypothetical protein